MKISNLSLNGLFSPFNFTSKVFFSGPNVAKSKSRAGAAVKQQFRRRQKDLLQRDAQPTGRKEMLTEALFKITNEKEPVEGKILEERATISKAWSRLQMLRHHTQCSWERAFLSSKLRAMEELRKVSSELAIKAEEIDYNLPPTHRRIMTETPPEPLKFPFS